MPTAPPHPDWTTEGSIDQVRDALERRQKYRDEGPITLVETHISAVFLTSRHVFKFKRPVNLGFANFSSLASRARFCQAELRLNRRLAPDVYLGRLPLRQGRRGYTFNGDGPIVDWCVVMRRIPGERMLDARLTAECTGGPPVTSLEITHLANQLARFHRRTRSSPARAHLGGLDTWRTNWNENFDQVRPELGRTLAAEGHLLLKQRIGDFLRENRTRLQARVAGGCVRNGHGDLRCEHIALGDPLEIIDCIEFNDRFRWADVANDVAFLLMDLCFFGRPDLARTLWAAWQTAWGEAGAQPLVGFYLCYRAFVRGKVLGFRLRDPNLNPEERQRTQTRARRFFALAKAFAGQMGPPAVLAMTGLMGSGKSKLSGNLAARTGAVWLRSDEIRKELAAQATETPESRTAAFGAGLYTADWTRRTYDALFSRAEALLMEGRSVVLDASFSDRTQRQRVQALARRFGAEAWLLECTAPDEELRRRLRRRAEKGTGPSDGREALLDAQRRTYQPNTGWPRLRYLRVDTLPPAETVLKAVLATPGLHIPNPLFSLPPEVPACSEPDTATP